MSHSRSARRSSGGSVRSARRSRRAGLVALGVAALGTVASLWPATPASALPPVANPDTYTTSEDTPLTVGAPGVLGNDTDVDGPDALTALDSVGGGPSNGTLTFNTDGSFIYTPAANFNGTDSFIYAAYDGLEVSLARVTINVTPVNDAPRRRPMTATRLLRTPR